VGFISILLIAVAMATDVFAVSLSIGATRQANRPRSIFRLAFHFGLFQFFMPILGYLAGSTFTEYIHRYDHWIALGLLGFVGMRMVRAGFDPDQKTFSKDPSKGKTLVILSVATSVDALSVGLSLAMLGLNIVYPSVIIGIVSSLFSVTGLLAGHRLGTRFGKGMEIVGGLILIGIGLRILFVHLSGQA
jgi:putative Mn2+ efflux pump MntP